MTYKPTLEDDLRWLKLQTTCGCGLPDCRGGVGALLRSPGDQEDRRYELPDERRRRALP